MLKGGITVDVSGPAHLYFESKNTTVEIWVDSVSLQPFTQKQWKSHQDLSIEKVGKRDVRIQAVDAEGNPFSNATIRINQKRSGFPFGCSINKNILTNTAYQNWFTSRPFTVTTFENEMKWYSTETSQGKEDYLVSDAMLKFAQQHNIAVRGHNVFWDDPRHQPSWITWLPRKQLALASSKRLYSIMAKYKGQVIGWDVVNENLHFSYFEHRILRSASEFFYNWAYKADKETTLFMNEYNTIEDPGDLASSPAKYLQKLKEIQNFPGNIGIMMGIGLEGHFSTPNLPYIRAAIDTLAAANLPIWVTELDVKSSPNQAMYLEQILREIRSHPKVKGIVLWSAWRPEGCFRMCLTDNNFTNLNTGDVVDKLLREWGWEAFTTGTTDAEGFFETSLFHGDYHVEITNLNVKNHSSLHHFLTNVPPITTTSTPTTTMSQQTSTLQLLLQVQS
ncbi:hypothetical protein FNV43_RR22651 [Rhamnella rubrinervis]|uniref:GH10 domain-containing protein n=1 Tax=Rhamnella rubrinervis TaxID=2594499 RepID=A0A8K0E2C8_9ROSA|nr:hypothetical protein FNV43_RR22651 [Rhamnella rubrinervis]